MRSISFFVSLELYLIIRSTSFGRMMCQLQGGRMKNEAALKPKAKLLIFVMMPMPDTLLLDVNGMKIELCYYKILYNRCCLAPQLVAQFGIGTYLYYIYCIASFAPSTGPKFKIQSCNFENCKRVLLFYDVSDILTFQIPKLFIKLGTKILYSKESSFVCM